MLTRSAVGVQGLGMRGVGEHALVEGELLLQVGMPGRRLSPEHDGEVA